MLQSLKLDIVNSVLIHSIYQSTHHDTVEVFISTASRISDLGTFSKSNNMHSNDGQNCAAAEPKHCFMPQKKKIFSSTAMTKERRSTQERYKTVAKSLHHVNAEYAHTLDNANKAEMRITRLEQDNQELKRINRDQGEQIEAAQEELEECDQSFRALNEELTAAKARVATCLDLISELRLAQGKQKVNLPG